MKPPGIGIEENSAFAPAVLEVATAVPAFIGYTAFARDGGSTLHNKPVRLASMSEYLHFFGGPPKPVFKLALVPDPDPADVKAATDARGQMAEFVFCGRTFRLTRPALRAGGRFLMHQALTHFFQNGGGVCYVVSVGDYSQEIEADGEYGGLIVGLKTLAEEPEHTLVLVPDAVLLSEPDCTRVQRDVLQHCSHTMGNRMAILDIWGGDRDRNDAEFGWDCIDAFRNGIGSDHLKFASAYYPWVHTSLVQANDLDDSIFGDSVSKLAPLLQAESGLNTASNWAADPVQGNVLGLQSLREHALEAARKLINLTPPSAAMAGLYTWVDNHHGVWKAPANVSMVNVVRPAVTVSQAELEDLQLNLQGKSINALCSFPEAGTLVWGARTLDGNSLDWLYINVRRTVRMLEEACRLAIREWVFQPNGAHTWVGVKSMISDFLVGIWKRGGLVGAAPEDAFNVQVGLGETMTSADILEGILRITVLVAVTHPAEFIGFTFQQQMAGS